MINGRDFLRQENSVISYIKESKSLYWEVCIRHIYHEVNVCADMLAHVGCELSSTVIIYESCSAQISYFVIVDAWNFVLKLVIL
jgi:hypothetical protein